jgi:DUF4097 and DUF4098 domain-containing protein YvlB
MRRLSLRSVALVAGLCLSATGAAACDISIGDTGFNVGMASNKATETWTRNYDVAARGQFEVVNTNGLVEVLQGTGSKVEVSAEKIAKASSDEAAKDLLRKIEIIETVKPDSVRLETKTPKTFGSGGAEVKYTIKVPAGLRVRAGTTNGGIKLTGISNDVEASTTNGGVNGEDLSGTIDASTTNGGVHLALAKLGSGGLKAETTNGGVSVSIPSDTKATVSAHVTNGGLGVSNLNLVATEQNRRHLEGTLNGGGPSIELGTTNGGISLTGK